MRPIIKKPHMVLKCSRSHSVSQKFILFPHSLKTQHWPSFSMFVQPSVQPRTHSFSSLLSLLCDINTCAVLTFSSVPSGEARLSGSSDHEPANEEATGAPVQRAAQHQHLGDRYVTRRHNVMTCGARGRWWAEVKGVVLTQMHGWKKLT